MITKRWQQIAILLLTSWLAACSTARQAPLPRQEMGDAPTQVVAEACNLPPDASRSQYVIGYGSLMLDESRKRTSPQAGPANPVEVRGYRRGWFARPVTVGYGTTFLGVVPDREGHFNAVIYQVDPAELAATDRREMLYCRSGVDASDVTELQTQALSVSGGQAWIYVSMPQNIATPSSRYPIVQSYVDIFVSGCLEQEQRFGLKDFSQECLTTTTDWSVNWVNDRIYPRRPSIYQPKARQIDDLLHDKLRQYFSTIKMESGG
jgi:cation transport regulator ChaC